MRHRVVPYANSIGSYYYNPKRASAPRNWLRNNRRWIRKQMKDGKFIIDIGPDEARRHAGWISEYYEMERHEILSRGYTLYRREPLP